MGPGSGQLRLGRQGGIPQQSSAGVRSRFSHTKFSRLQTTRVKQSRQVCTSRSKHSKTGNAAGSHRLCSAKLYTDTRTTPEREGDCVILCSAHSCNGELLAVLHSGSIELLRLPLGLRGQSENVPKHPIPKLIPSLTCRHRPGLTVCVCWEQHAQRAQYQAPPGPGHICI